MEAGLDHVKRAYEEWGSEDPFHAVLTKKSKRKGGWDVQEFFRTGEREIEEVMGRVEALGLDPASGPAGGRALDFGSGVGRLSQALAGRFARVLGVDISSSMVEKARELNRHGERVRYLVNARDDLALLEDGSFDFVYSSITLQHVPPRFVRRYIREFFRVLVPGGVAVFQMRSGPRIRPGSLRERLYRLNREHLRRLLQRLRRKPAYEIHFLARSEIEELIAASGGRLLDVLDVSGPGRSGKSYRYCAMAGPGGPAPGQR